MKYKIEITEKHRVYIDIEANCEGDAASEAQRMCDEGEVNVSGSAQRVEREYRVVHA